MSMSFSWLWPIQTGQTFFDYWTLSHLAFWLVAGSTIAAFGWNRITSFYSCLGVALAWEIFERIAEKLWPATWTHPESFVNFALSDILACVVALFVAWHGFDKWRP